MRPLLERLESRRLFSASPAQVTALLTDRTTLQGLVKADKTMILGRVKGVVAAVRALTTDLRKTRSAPNATLANTFHRDAAAGAGLLFIDLRKLLAEGTAAGQRLVADALRLAKKPTSASLMARINAEATTLFNLANNNAFSGDATSVQQTVGADLDQIASANPSNAAIQADVTSDRNLVQALAKTAQADGNALINALGTLFNDIHSIAPAS